MIVRQITSGSRYSNIISCWKLNFIHLKTLLPCCFVGKIRGNFIAIRKNIVRNMQLRVSLYIILISKHTHIYMHVYMYTHLQIKKKIIIKLT